MTLDETPPPPARPTLETLVGRALRLRCPRCGRGALFRGWFAMPVGCSECGLKYERAPGYFLGSTYINYALTAICLTIVYSLLHFGLRMTNRQLALPLSAFVIVIPLVLFRHARALWLAMDCHFDASILSGEDD